RRERGGGSGSGAPASSSVQPVLGLQTWRDENAPRAPSTRRWLEELRSVALVRKELSAHGDVDAVTLRVRLALHGHVEVDGAHDAVAELLLDELLPRGAVDL